jgi:hypothetical protein
MRRSLLSIPVILSMALAACSPSMQPQAETETSPAIKPVPGTSVPANPSLGSPQWYAWVDQSLAVSDDGHGPKPGSVQWDSAVQVKLGQEAPQAAPGSPEWLQAVDGLLRTRVAPTPN